MTPQPQVLDLLPRRIGRFRIACARVRNWPYYLPAFAKMFVVRCEQQFDTGCFEYMALSELFDEIDEGATAPMYKITITDQNKILAERL